MKKIGLVFFLLLLITNLFGQSLRPKEKKKNWGYVNKEKKFIIKPIFEKAERFKNSSAIVKTKEKYKMIDEKGEFLTSLDYDTLYRSNSFAIYRVDSKYGVLDSLGNQLSDPLFEKIDGYNGDGFTVKLNGKWVSWTQDSGIEEIEELVFINPDEYPIFGANCLNLAKQEEILECSNKALLMTIYRNIRYPYPARESGIQGTVVLGFLIKSDGSISDFELLKDLGGGCGEEA